MVSIAVADGDLFCEKKALFYSWKVMVILVDKLRPK